MAQHIFNLTEIKSRMINPPKAQRLQRLMNKNEFDLLDQEQVEDLINIIQRNSETQIKFLIENVPFVLKIK